MSEGKGGGREGGREQNYLMVVLFVICSRIAEGLEQSLPALETAVLVNNNLEELVCC